MWSTQTIRQRRIFPIVPECQQHFMSTVVREQEDTQNGRYQDAK